MKLNLRTKNLLYIFFFMLCLFQFSPVKSQHFLLKEILESKDSINKIQFKIDQLFSQNVNDFSKKNWADLNHDVALHWYFSQWKKSNLEKYLDSAILHTKKAVEIKQSLDSIDTYSIKKSLYNLGYLYGVKDDVFHSNEFFQEIIEFPEFDDRTLNAYERLVVNFRKIGDFNKAINCYENFILNLESNESYDLSLIIDTHTALAQTYAIMGYKEYSTEIESIIQNVDSINTLSGSMEPYQFARLENLRGNLNLILENYPDAIQSHRKILQNKFLTEDYSPARLKLLKATINSNLAVSLDKIGDSSNASEHLKKAIELNPKSSLPFENLGDLYASRKHFKEGLKNYQKAIYLASNQDLNEDISALPKIENLKFAIEKKYLLGHLIQKANAWLNYYKHDGNTAHLTHALTTFERADELIDIIRTQSTEYQSKLYWRGQSSKLYMKAVEVSFLLNRPHKAYYFMERNKALLLLEDITHEKAKELSQLPDSIAKREFELKRAILLAENTLQNNSSASPDSLQNFKNDIFQYKRSYEKFMDSLTIAFPDYARLKQQFQVLPYQDFKSNFSSEETATLQFILNDEQGYALLHTNGEPQFYELENAESLNKNLLTFYASLSKFDKDLDSAKKVSNTIFKTLLPETAFESIKNKELIIVPDYNLQKIPFEALVTDTANKRYLLEDVELRYAYSLSYLEAKKQVQTQAEEDLLALAPVDFENLGLAKLGFSGLEVDALKSIFGGETWLNENASKENLLKNLHKHGILHFATHADIDENGNHWVAFSDDKLYLNEIYATRNQADMVVLSACNTSRGELKNGEGVMSLARAFFNSGAKSVVSSLWPTIDKTSKDIMVDFYSGLDEGLPKATALRNAKLTYLQNNPGASPAQWAALIVIGDNRPVRNPNFFDNNWHWMALAGGLLVVPVFLWRRRQNQAA